ncbi:hypothetical protein MUN81_21630 [Hymenobacter sp. 5317J-9]|uniref:hypothetical protein n=1 Tax=Hymenobacter sp. 5317J-9 TaxID=2932250 RepID=UPI001FD69A92|nr:hypothetical protein [Hymenobacter sp. 5317J-9]UOQ97814.1 hypothetical protein MUN81_21630 [Hymenobacter sp. 5317J-9]
MKTLPKILLAVLALFVLSSIGGYFYFRQQFLPPANQLVVSGLPATTPFAWLADTAAGRAVPHAAVLVPVQLPNCPRTCYLQFDTGAPYSVLYARPLAALQARYPALRPALTLYGDTLRDFRFALGRGQVQARWVKTRDLGAAALPADSLAPFIIGTLGGDVVDGRALVLDYARQRFSLLLAVPDSLVRRTDFVPLAFDSRRPVFTAGLQGEPRKLFFDTGTSAFALLTSEGEWQKLARPGAPVRTSVTSSWGRPLTSYTAPTAAAMRLGTATVPLGTVSHMTGTSFTQNLLMRFSGMGGMLGNEPFSQRAVVLDVAGGRFGLVRP